MYNKYYYINYYVYYCIIFIFVCVIGGFVYKLSLSLLEEMDPAKEIVKHASHCFVPKLSRNVEEIDNHPEYYDRKNNFETHFPPILEIISKGDLRDHPEFTKTIMPTLIMLYLERSSSSPWNNEKCLGYALKLDRTFQSAYRLSLANVFHNSEFCNIQEVFDNLLMEFNMKVTSQDFKKYPGLIQCYDVLVMNTKDFKVTYNLVTIFPICLLLVEDYVFVNCVRGLKLCLGLFNYLDKKYYHDGNYYEVIFSSLKKTMTIKKLEITKLVHECLLEFIGVLPANVQESKTDEIFGIILEQIHMESNLHRKTACFGFIKNILMIHKVNCVNKRLLKTVLSDNVHVCCNDAVADILLVDVLQTLQVWITHCWCVWRLSTDHKLLSALIKLLYVSRKEKIASEIQELIVSLISLCSEEEQQSILKNLKQSEITSPEFQEKLEEIKNDISV